MEYKILDMQTYKRKAHFEYFRSLPYPYVGTTAEVDVAPLLKYCKANGRSFYLAVLHAAALAADQIPELRQRIHDDGIIEYSECPTSHVELLEDQTYCYCTVYHHMPLDVYFDQAEAARKACKNNGIEEEEDAESMYFISTLPWLHYTALIQPVAGGDESNPRITWGRYEEKADGTVLMPVSILVHHALADGLQIAAFYQNLEQQIRLFAEG